MRYVFLAQSVQHQISLKWSANIGGIGPPK